MSEFANDFDKQRLMQLVNARCNGELDDEGNKELEAMLVASPSAREEYWSFMQIHADLEWELLSNEKWDSAIERLLGEKQTLDRAVETLAGAEGLRRRPLSSRTALLLSLAACLLVGVFIGVYSPWREVVMGERDTPKLSVPGGVAEVSLLGRLTPLLPNSRWSFGRRSDRNSPDVHLGDTLSIDVGAVALRLSNNVVAQMQAPMVFQLVSAKHVRLLHGRIQVDVPAGAKGFSVETASAEIVDLGTSFSVAVVDEGTDLIVHEGEVDLSVTGASVEKQQTSAGAKRFRTGEAVRVHYDGTLSRIVDVHSPNLVASETVPSDKPLIVSVRDNLIRDDMWSFYEIVPGGLVEDAKAWVDRPHEWNGATAEGLPDYLVGADYVKTFNDDKITSNLVIELELSGPAEVYVFLDKRVTPPPWLVEQFSETGDTIGIDEERYDRSQITGVGPGVSIDNTVSVWKRVAKHGGVVRLGPNGDPMPNNAVEVIYVPSAMYGIAAVRIDKDVP